MEIGTGIKLALIDYGHTADLRSTQSCESLEGYDAAIIGSAVYFGKWRTDAVKFLNQHSEALSKIPAWLFSSGPISDVKQYDPVDLKVNMDLAHAREHRLFGGYLGADPLGPIERLVTRVVKARAGDWRSWAEMQDWAQDLANELAIVEELHLHRQAQMTPVAVGD